MSLDLLVAHDHPELLARPVRAAITSLAPELATRIRVAAIDAELADTAAFCDAYGVAPEASANCLVVSGRRGEETRIAACVVLATTRADINGAVRKLIDARKASFMPMAEAVELTGMEYGGITPIGLPSAWRILVDYRVALVPEVVVGAGIRGAKISLPGEVLAGLPGVEVIDGLARS